MIYVYKRYVNYASNTHSGWIVSHTNQISQLISGLHPSSHQLRQRWVV